MKPSSHSNKHYTFPLDSWTSYEYIGLSFPYHRCHSGHVEQQGGEWGASPFVWVDDTQWSIDTPESPHSILALLSYASWSSQAPLDLRGASVEFRLRGDELDLKGGSCFFWVTTERPVTRWHYVDAPLVIPEGSWSEKIQLSIDPSPKLWHQSYPPAPQPISSLDRTLKAVFSCGFSFVGFTEKVTGRFSLCDFQIVPAVDRAWSYAADFSNPNSEWLMVSAKAGKQITISSVGTPYFDATGQKSYLAFVEDDFLLFSEAVPFSYLIFSPAAKTEGKSLINTLLHTFILQENFQPCGGRVLFFVEQATSGTRWVYTKEDFTAGEHCLILDDDERNWFRLTGEVPLSVLLAGGYDYFGFLLVGPTATPSGLWGIIRHFSIGPCLDNTDCS